MTSLADCDNYQFGFKAGHSRTLCASVFRHTVDYFVTTITNSIKILKIIVIKQLIINKVIF